jgi:hypothetical protein
MSLVPKHDPQRWTTEVPSGNIILGNGLWQFNRETGYRGSNPITDVGIIPFANGYVTIL